MISGLARSLAQPLHGLLVGVDHRLEVDDWGPIDGLEVAHAQAAALDRLDPNAM